MTQKHNQPQAMADSSQDNMVIDLTGDDHPEPDQNELSVRQPSTRFTLTSPPLSSSASLTAS